MTPTIMTTTNLAPTSVDEIDIGRDKVTQVELDRVLDQHEAYVKHRAGGARCNLKLRDLSFLDFNGRDLSEADFSGAKLFGCNLRNTKMVGSILFAADLRTVGQPADRAARVLQPVPDSKPARHLRPARRADPADAAQGQESLCGWLVGRVGKRFPKAGGLWKPGRVISLTSQWSPRHIKGLVTVSSQRWPDILGTPLAPDDAAPS